MTTDADREALKAALAQAPADLDVARRYWRAMGHSNGTDVRSGGYVVHAFRAAALASAEGAAALAEAYQELFAVSSEKPRLAYVDRELRVALQRALKQLQGDDHKRVAWVLGCVERR